jgi:hypothetical protein
VTYDVKKFKRDPQREKFEKSRCLATGDAENLRATSPGFARTTHFLDQEEPEDFKQILAELHDEFRPVGFSETLLVERMAQSQWFGMRFAGLQTIQLRPVAGYRFPSEVPAIVRCQFGYDRAFYKARNEFLKLRGNRNLSEIGFVSQKTETAAAGVPDHFVNLA